MLRLSLAVLISSSLLLCVQGKPFCFEYKDATSVKDCEEHDEDRLALSSNEDEAAYAVVYDLVPNTEETQGGENDTTDLPTLQSEDVQSRRRRSAKDVELFQRVADNDESEGEISDDSVSEEGDFTPIPDDTQSRRRRSTRPFDRSPRNAQYSAEEDKNESTHVVDDDESEGDESDESEAKESSTDSEDAQSRKLRSAKDVERSPRETQESSNEYTDDPTYAVDDDNSEGDESDDPIAEEDFTPIPEDTQSRKRRSAKPFSRSPRKTQDSADEDRNEQTHVVDDDKTDVSEDEYEEDSTASEDTQSRRRRNAKAYERFTRESRDSADGEDSTAPFIDDTPAYYVFAPVTVIPGSEN